MHSNPAIENDSSTFSPLNPLRYEPSFELVEEDEVQVIQDIVRKLVDISNTTFKHGGMALRSVHAKSHGLLRGQLQVLPLTAPYNHGLFSQPGVWPAQVRLSTSPGDLLDDRVSTPRGFALKVLNVPGERLAGEIDGTNQEFLLVDAPVFPVPSLKKFLGQLKLLAITTDKAPQLKQALSALLRGGESVLEAFGTESVALQGLGGHPLTQCLGETFYSQLPFLYGPYMAKWSVAPVSPALLALTDKPLALGDSGNPLREAVVNYFHDQAAEWELRVQLCTDIERMPIEDATVAWSESESPFVPVARLHVPPQVAWSEALSIEFDEGLSFSPWHGLAAHRPLGAFNRARREAYAASASVRLPRGRCPVHRAG